MKLLLVCSANFSDYLLYSNRKLELNYKPRKWRARNALYVDDYPGLFLNCRIHLCKYYWWFSKFSPHLIYVLGFFFLLQWQGKFFSLGILIWRFWLNLVYSSEKKQTNLKAHMTLELSNLGRIQAKNELLCTYRTEKKWIEKNDHIKEVKMVQILENILSPCPYPSSFHKSQETGEKLCERWVEHVSGLCISGKREVTLRILQAPGKVCAPFLSTIHITFLPLSSWHHQD